MALPFFSSTRTIPDITVVPRHIAIIMDGNGRWAKQRFMPRVMGHQRGVETVREMVKACRQMGVEYLTLFAFSSENWRRPADEVSFLMQLFLKMLEREIGKLHENNIRLKIIGDRSRFDAQLVRYIEEAERLTANNPGLTLTIAANYGGRWDIMQAMHALSQAHPERASAFSEEELHALSFHALCAGTGLVHPYRRRTAHQQLPVVAIGLHRVVFHRHLVARLRPRSAGGSHSVLPETRTPLR